MTPGIDRTAVITFLREEARGLWGAFWRVFWKVTLVAALLLVIMGLLGSRGGATQPEESFATQLFAYTAVGIYFGAILGAVVGLFSALWRLFGPSLLAVLVVAPILIVVVLWLFHGPIASSAIHFLDSVIASARQENLRQTTQAAEGMRLSCGGGAIGVLFLVLLAPFVIADIGAILADSNVLWAFLKFAGIMALTFTTATTIAFLFACPVLILAMLRRGRRRFQQLKGVIP